MFDPAPEQVEHVGRVLSAQSCARRAQSLFVAAECDRRRGPAGAVLPRHGRALSRDEGENQPRHHRRNLERHLQSGAVPVDGRPLHADDRDAARALSLCRHSLVFDDVRPRRPDHRDADAVVRSQHRARRAAGGWRRIRRPTSDPLSDAEPGKILHEMRAGEMAELREVPFGLYYGSVDSTPLFVMLAGLYVERTGDHRDVARAVAEHRSGAALDRRTGRSGRRRLCRISPRHRRGTGQSGLEGFAGRRLPCRRASGRRADRARRGAGLCLCRQAAGGAIAPSGSATPSRRRSLRAQAGRLAERFDGGVLVPGDRHLRAGARRRQAAMRGAHLECRPGAVHRASRTPSARRRSPPD